MSRNLKNWRVLFSIFGIAMLTSLWQNCSQTVGFEEATPSLVHKIGYGEEILSNSPPIGTLSEGNEDAGSVGGSNDSSGSGYDSSGSGSVSHDDSSSDSHSDGGSDVSSGHETEDPVGSVESLEACDLKIQDIIINVDYLHLQGDQQNLLPLQSQNGLLSLKRMMNSGLMIRPLDGSMTSNTINLVLQSQDHYLLLEDGTRRLLRVISSQTHPGIKVRLEKGPYVFTKDSSLVLKLIQWPELKKMGHEEGCRLENNLSGEVVGSL